MLFGFAINSDPKHLPTAVLLADHGPQGRTLLQAMQNSGYFHFVAARCRREAEAATLLARGEVLFVVNIPENFTPRSAARRPARRLLVEADATDPAATSNAHRLAAARCSIRRCATTSRARSHFWPARPAPIELRVHARYNPEAITQYNIVPGLMGVVLTMTMVMITGLAITRERERGTMENLLVDADAAVRGDDRQDHALHPGRLHPGGADPARGALPVRRADGRQPAAAARRWRCVFIVANLAMGITFSTIAQEPAAGDADVVLLLPAVDPAVGVHVPVSRDAGLGAVHRRSACR